MSTDRSGVAVSAVVIVGLILIMILVVMFLGGLLKGENTLSARDLAKIECRWHKGLKSMRYAAKADKHGQVMVPNTLLMREVVCRDGTKILTNWEVY